MPFQVDEKPAFRISIISLVCHVILYCAWLFYGIEHKHSDLLDNVTRILIVVFAALWLLMTFSYLFSNRSETILTLLILVSFMHWGHIFITMTMVCMCGHVSPPNPIFQIADLSLMAVYAYSLFNPKPVIQ
jgi:hypothetical protein